ncbi:hypothetical protein ACGFRG_05410 [Streptomyces sp. NPDC048696]|uniref:hypothetical protein n=1 Tax=Streptomyces sp. NPDC048696 TaxID=3365585 RepID=UPI0037216D7A
MPQSQVHGPVKSFKLTLGNRSFGITRGTKEAVPGGRTLTVDTRPGFKTAQDDQGKNY